MPEGCGGFVVFFVVVFVSLSVYGVISGFSLQFLRLNGNNEWKKWT